MQILNFDEAIYQSWGVWVLYVYIFHVGGNFYWVVVLGVVAQSLKKMPTRCQVWRQRGGEDIPVDAFGRMVQGPFPR